MRDVDDRHAAGLEPPEGLEQRADLARLERRGRLVEDQYPGPLTQRAADRDQLALGEAQAVDPLVERDANAEPIERAPRVLGHGTAIDRQAPRRQMPEHDVLGDRQGRDQPQLLGDHDDAGGERGARIGEAARRAVEPHGPAVRLVGTAQNLDQGRLAGAVLADQRVDLAAAQRERHVGERLGGAEPLREVVDGEPRIGHGTRGQRATRATVIRASTKHPRSITVSLSSMTVQSRIGTS